MPSEKLTNNDKPRKLAAELNASGFFDAVKVGGNTVSAISIMGEHENLAGNVLRRLCRLGGEACSQTCAIHKGLVERAQANMDAKCADENLSQVLDEAGLNPENVLMVGVTGNSVGFVDEIDANPEKYKYALSPVTGVKELAGFNAFFSREGDAVAGDEVFALGRRLADCGDINLEFTTQDGSRVMGFMHLTRSNLQGEGAEKYRRENNLYDEHIYRYFMQSAFDHYGMPDIEQGIDVRIAAAIRPDHYVFNFESPEKMQEMFPNWDRTETLLTKGNQLIKNISNPEWEPGDAFNPTDKFQMDFRGMIEWQIRRFSPALAATRINGKPAEETIDWGEVVDPGDADSPHASNYRGRTGGVDADGRDAYLTMWATHPSAKT